MLNKTKRNIIEQARYDIIGSTGWTEPEQNGISAAFGGLSWVYPTKRHGKSLKRTVIEAVSPTIGRVMRAPGNIVNRRRCCQGICQLPVVAESTSCSDLDRSVCPVLV